MPYTTINTTQQDSVEALPVLIAKLVSTNDENHLVGLAKNEHGIIRTLGYIEAANAGIEQLPIKTLIHQILGAFTEDDLDEGWYPVETGAYDVRLEDGKYTAYPIVDDGETDMNAGIVLATIDDLQAA